MGERTYRAQLWGVAILLAGFLTGGVEAGAAASGVGSALFAFLFVGPLVSLVTFPCGLISVFGLVVVARSLRSLGVDFETARDASLDEQLRRRAIVLATAVAAVGLVLGVALLLIAVRSVTETPELIVTGILGSVVVLLVSGASVPVLARVFKWGLSKVGPLSRLWFVRSALARYVILGLLPGGLGGVLAIVSTPSPELRVVGALWVFFLVVPALFLFLRNRNVRGAWLLGFVGIWLGLFVWSSVALDVDAVAAAQRPGLSRLSIDTLSALGDPDGDGQSVFFRGSETEEADRGGAAQQIVLRQGPIESGALETSAVRKYNVVWLMVDALRADHLHLLGGAHENTPTLEELAKESLVFSHAFSQSSGTPTSIASMLTGKTPGSIRWTNGKGGTSRPQLDEKMVTVAERFRKAGYRTAGSLSEGMLDLIPKTLQGFDEVRGLPGKTGSSELVIDMLNGDRKFSKGKVTSPFFVFGYYHGPHGPYRGEFEFGNSSRQKYDSAIKRTDAELRVVIDYLKHHPKIWENTIVVIHSDHGEEFEEHGQIYHNNTCHIESVRIPIILRVPGLKAARVDLPVANVDIVPTLLELSGIETPSEEELDGESLLIPALTDRGRPDRPILCFQQNRKGDGKMHGSVRTDQWYLDVALGGGPKKLFDVSADPKELKNVYKKHASDPTVQGLFELIERHHTGNLNRGKWAKM